MKYWIRRVEKTDSSQDHLFRLARKGAPVGTVVVAGEQTKGRGRLGRRWESPRGGLYFSVLAPPLAAPGSLPLIAGLAVCDAVKALGIRPRIKWPNDVLVDEKKLAGVLCESRDGFLTAGIGVNLTEAPLNTAVSIQRLISDSQTAPTGESLLNAILSAFSSRLDRPDTADEVNNLLFGRGTTVRHEGRSVVICEVSAAGGLVVTDGGARIEITSGEITFDSNKDSTILK